MRSRTARPVDHDALSSELVRALRGKRSQTAFSRRLGYRSNVVYGWESGRRWPSSSAFFAAARKTGIDLRAALARFFPSAPPWLAGCDLTTRTGVSALLAELRGTRKLRPLARQVGVSRVALAGWMQARGEPRLPELLRIVDATSLRLLDFVALLADPAVLPSTRRAWTDLEVQRRVAYELPFSHAILRCIETTAYKALPRHDAEWLAARLRVPRALVDTCVRALVAAGQLRRKGRRYAPERVMTVDTLPSREQGRGLKRFWGEVALSRLDRLEGGGSAYYSYNLYAVAERDLPRIRDLHFAYYDELRRIVAASEPSERVLLSHLWLVPLDE